ncbi:MAG TPA: hypothetical protein VGZ90_12720 [Puia sp.]|jgi:hypothetical protein|nr:hypothetical protein [Puia sp.]
MKPLTLNFILLLFTYCVVAQSNNSGASGTEILNHIYYFRPDSLIALEMTDGQMESKTKALGYGGSEAGIVIDGDKSHLRIKSGDSIRFTIKMAMAMMDPTMIIKLYRFDLRKGKREAVLSSQGGAYSHSKSTSNASEINLNVLKSGSDAYIMIPATRLAPGEYGFINMMMVKMQGSRTVIYTIFAFGVD